MNVVNRKDKCIYKLLAKTTKRNSNYFKIKFILVYTI